MPELVPVAPDVLVWARESALASVAEAAERVNRDPATILDWEVGRAQPTYGQLERLADEYGVSVNVLLLPQRPQIAEPPPDFRSPSGGREPLSRIARREIRRGRHLQGLLADVPVLPPLALPHLGPSNDEAGAIRNALGVPVAQQLAWPSPHFAFNEWRAALNRLGILVLQYKLARDALQGLSLAAAVGGPPVILINQGDWINARNFTLLHELAHLILGGDGAICDPWRRGARPTSDSLEARCNRLAGEVLVPADHLRDQSESTLIAAENDEEETLKLLATLGRRYKVSSQVVWYRIHHLGLVNDARFRSLWPKLRPPTAPRRPRADDEERSGVPRWRMATSRYGPQLLSGLLGAADRGALEQTDVMRALSLGTGDLARLQGEER